VGGRRGWPGPGHGRAPTLAAQESAQRRAVGAGDPAGKLYAQLPPFATAVLVSVTTGRRKELRGKLLVGAAGQIAACVLLLTLGPGSAICLLVGIALIFGLPQGLNGLTLQNSAYLQADSDRIGSSAGLLRTFIYLGAIIASAAQGAFYGRTAGTGGLHHLAMFMLVIGVLFLAITVADRSLHHISSRQDTDRYGPPVARSDLSALPRSTTVAARAVGYATRRGPRLTAAVVRCLSSGLTHSGSGRGDRADVATVGVPVGGPLPAAQTDVEVRAPGRGPDLADVVDGHVLPYLGRRP
jgi:hypothetical protein